MKNLFGETKGTEFLNGTVFGASLLCLVGIAVAFKAQWDKIKEDQEHQKRVREMLDEVEEIMKKNEEIES